MANYRVGRVRQEILKEVSQALRKVVKDPRVERVTITDVDLTGDLQEATIYYSTISDLAGERQKTQAGLDAATGLIRREIGKALTTYKTPEIRFKRDESIDYGNRIDDLLRQIKSEDDNN